jgi:hypothetical protein
MMLKTLWLPGFSHRLSGRRAGTARKLVEQSDDLGGLAGIATRFLGASKTLATAPGKRDRVFSVRTTFWAFLSQVLSRSSSCREAVCRVQAWRSARHLSVPDEGTSGYCQARARLPLALLKTVHEHLQDWFVRRAGPADLWCGRSVKVLDGTGVSMPDTRANRKRWCYAGCQKPGCGFPTAQVVALFCLATGRMIRFALDSWKAHEIPLARQLVQWIEAGEVVLTDRGFCGWGFIAVLQRKGVDVVMRAHQARHLAGKRMTWAKPQCPSSWERSLWRELPESISVRIVRFRVCAQGFRTKRVTLVTTLLDAQTYTDEQIAQLYFRRWRAELYFRDIKTTLGLDVLRCQSPAMIEKEIWMHVIAHNLVRALMLEAALTHQVSIERLSFKGTVDAIRHWQTLLPQSNSSHRAKLLLRIAADKVPHRPFRSEPRARKRRPKPYQWLTAPRRKMTISPTRFQK